MNEEQLEFPVVPGKRAKKGMTDSLDFEAQLRGRHFCPQCGHDAAHAIVSNYQLCEECDFDYGMTARAYFEHKPGEDPGLSLHNRAMRGIEGDGP
jgi:ribosomal protein L37AE/L43A